MVFSRLTFLFCLVISIFIVSFVNADDGQGVKKIDDNNNSLKGDTDSSDSDGDNSDDSDDNDTNDDDNDSGNDGDGDTIIPIKSTKQDVSKDKNILEILLDIILWPVKMLLKLFSKQQTTPFKKTFDDESTMPNEPPNDLKFPKENNLTVVK